MPKHPKFVNRTGNTVGQYTVLKYTGHEYWVCVCNKCGTERNIPSAYLAQGRAYLCKICTPRITSQGKRYKSSKPPGEVAFNSLFLRYMHSARHRKVEWALDKEQAKALFNGDCFYCGHPPSSITPKPGSKEYQECKSWFLYNGIDRVDNSRGYTTKNCVSCCKVCNYMKHILSVEEFLSHIYAIHNHCNLTEKAA